MSAEGNSEPPRDSPETSTATATATTTTTTPTPPDHDMERSESLRASIHEDKSEELAIEHEVHRLARSLSRVSTSATVDNPLQPPKDSSIDPHSDNFRARSWMKSMLKLQAQSGLHPRDRSIGVSFTNLNVFGFSTPTDYQKTVGNYVFEVIGLFRKLIGRGHQQRIDILRDLEGYVKPGEMLVVLGPPGSGCSTFLKTITGETHGFNVDASARINYQGISFKQMHTHFRGEAVYTAEQDVHFPALTVGDTLLFAATARAPRHIPGNAPRDVYVRHIRDATMATLGIAHTMNTQVGNEFVRGVSGGERKRVTIAEATLTGAPLQCWDNSTRGLDSANAIEFCKTLRNSTELTHATALVAIYQAPQAAYDTFDKALVLYQGRQIFFGAATEAQQYFEDMGFDCPVGQTTADFLTSMTSPVERLVRSGWESRVPNTPDEFAARWKASEQRQQLVAEIQAFEQAHPVGGPDLARFTEARRQQQSRPQRVESPFTMSYLGQVKLCLWRGFRRMAADPTLVISQFVANAIQALIVGSLFYNQPQTSDSLRPRSTLLFFAVLLNAFASALEILTLYAQRPIVEKHNRYALHHPSAEAFASILTDMPAKIGNAIAFNVVLYFLTNLRRTPGAFFYFFLFSFVLTMVMSMFFRVLASVSRSLDQALVPTAVIILAIIIYTGFTIPISYMLGWARWINYVNPTAYGFESLMVNEFSGNRYKCTSFIPPAPQFGNGSSTNQVCIGVGAVAGEPYIDGDRYINESFGYHASHRWRNLGILFGFMLVLLAVYLAATELISAKKSKGEVLVFRRTRHQLRKRSDEETGKSDEKLSKTKSGREVPATIQKQTAIFQWKDVCFDIKIKKDTRRILDHVDGWVKPGTLTALMGVSGAGKTTLLDCLASRVTIGVLEGEMLVDGHQRDESFQRKTGYVQQQDLHLETSTVREALSFSALLRQSAKTPKEEKLAYVEEVIKLLEMEAYADAVVGVPGEGLNVEQRKRLTIGVELAAKPQLLLFLDEPTSGLDSQTSWSILDLLEKLKDNGQAILCTIHQPSAMLFDRFDRLLLLKSGGQTVYFGPIGEHASVLSDYFVKKGAYACPPRQNPAEWMLEVIGAAPGSHTDIDWYKAWRESDEIKAVHAELEQMKLERGQMQTEAVTFTDKSDYREFAASFPTQMLEVQKRTFEQYWRTPNYIYSKLSLCIFSPLFIGFSFFRAPNTQQGLSNQMFGIFMLLTLFSQLVQQIMPLFVTQRSLYEARERPSKTYSWKAFMLSNMIAEIPWASVSAALFFFCWYYPIGLYKNAEATDAVVERGSLVFLFIWGFVMFSSTFSHMMIAGIPTAETASNVANLLFSMALLFCGVLATPEAMPRFWIFMYRVSPFTYLVEGILSGAIAHTPVTCADNEYLHFSAPPGATCGQYLSQLIQATGGYLVDENASECSYCTVSNSDTFLDSVSISYTHAWRDFGILMVYVVFNVFAALGIYWLARVPKGDRRKKEKKQKQQ